VRPGRFLNSARTETLTRGGSAQPARQRNRKTKPVLTEKEGFTSIGEAGKDRKKRSDSFYDKQRQEGKESAVRVREKKKDLTVKIKLTGTADKPKNFPSQEKVRQKIQRTLETSGHRWSVKGVLQTIQREEVGVGGGNWGRSEREQLRGENEKRKGTVNPSDQRPATTERE